MRQSKLFTVLLILALLGATVNGCSASTPEANREVSESIIAQIDSSSWIQESFRVSPDNQRVAYVARVGNKQLVAVDGVEGKQYDGTSTPVFSPDSQRVAYAAQVGNKQLVVVDGVEGKQYDGTSTPVFSPDSQRVAYSVQVGSKWLVVVDGVEGKQYGGIVNLGGGRIIFDSPDSLHYLAGKGNKFYLVEERIN